MKIYLKIVPLLLLLFVTIQAVFLVKLRQEHRALQDAVELLESGFKEEQEVLQLQFGALQGEIEKQEQLHYDLHRELLLLEQKRMELNTTKDEEKDAIGRLRDADSLRDAVSRHYRP